MTELIKLIVICHLSLQNCVCLFVNKFVLTNDK